MYSLHGGLTCITFITLDVVCAVVERPLESRDLFDYLSYLRKFYSWESESSPQYRGFLCAFKKSKNYTLRKFLPVNIEFSGKFQATGVSLV